MSSPAVQLSFNLRTSPNVRTVHLLGSWDTYKSQLPLSIVKDAKSGTWRGTFRFQGSNALKLGSRYWYYYIVDGYHVSHDPSKEFTTEKTTGRKLNILDVPGGKTSPDRTEAVRRPTVNTTNTSRHSREVPVGRALSPSKIVHPKPTKAYASRGIREADYERSPVDKDEDDELADRFASTRISDRGYDRHAAYASSPSDLSDSSSGPSFSGGSSPSSMSSISNGPCRCERFGVTRSGQRVKLDCGGAKCGYTSSDCSSSEQDSESESEEEYRARVRKEKEKQLEKARSGVKTDRHGKPVSSGSGHSSGKRR
jgi:hypothetical protein